MIAVVTGWGTLALWFRLPGPDAIRIAACGGFALLGLLAAVRQFGARRLWPVSAFAGVFACLLVWWATLAPPQSANWSPEVTRQVTGTIDGDVLTLTNVREFDWRSRADFTEVWTTRVYDLDRLETVDLFLSYWGGPQMAHLILSFGFGDDIYLALSVQVRREIDGTFSPVADAFKEHTLVIIAAVEQDVVGVRSNVRGEDVQMFRLQTPPDVARALLEEYVRDANRLAETPQWYNSITANCTTVIVRMLKAIGDGEGFDWRILANGYLPELAYERGAMNTKYSPAQLRDLGRIAPRALEAGLGPDFSRAIRAGVPGARGGAD